MFEAIQLGTNNKVNDGWLAHYQGRQDCTTNCSPNTVLLYQKGHGNQVDAGVGQGTRYSLVDLYQGGTGNYFRAKQEGPYQSIVGTQDGLMNIGLCHPVRLRQRHQHLAALTSSRGGSSAEGLKCMAHSVAAVLSYAPGVMPGAALLMLGAMANGSSADGAHRILAEVHEADLRCALVQSGSGGALRLSGEISARPALTGAYQFTVHKTSQSGTSNVHQGGEFSAGAGEAVSVGLFGTNDQAGSTYALGLVVTVDGKEKCRVTYDGPVTAGRED